MEAKSIKAKMPVGPHHNLLTKKVAIDCEMMASNIGQVLGRVSVINYNGETIFDTFVYYPNSVIIRNTDEEYSGIGWNDIDPQNGAQPHWMFKLSLLSSSRIELSLVTASRTI